MGVKWWYWLVLGVVYILGAFLLREKEISNSRWRMLECDMTDLNDRIIELESKKEV